MADLRTPMICCVLLAFGNPAMGTSDEGNTAQDPVRLAVREVLKDLEKVQGDNTAQRKLISGKIPLQSQVALAELLDAVTRAETTDELYRIRTVLSELKCEREPRLVARLRAQDDSRQKAKLLNVLADYSTEEVFRVLVEHLGDKRPAEDSHPLMVGQPRRVCDVAYNVVVPKCDAKGFKSPLGSCHSIQTRDQAIYAFKAYWETHGEGILTTVRRDRGDE